ncbi:MAG: transposase [Desulfobacterales bacterium]|nr:transposase [Desulfobacterales bacterium]
MQPKKHLSFSNLRKTISERALQIEDTRREGSVSHEIHDCCLSGFAMMFFQDPSMLAFQKRIQDYGNKNNLQTIFGVGSIPKSTQLRDVIDLIPSSSFDPIFSDFFSLLQRAKMLEKFQLFKNQYLISIDGTQYFTSENISCPGCLKKTSQKTGQTTYSHQFLGASIVHPEQRQVIPLAPEPIQNTDGNSKQDCERNAGKRLIQKIRKTHPKLNITITGDGLYSNQPFIDELKSNRMSFVLIAKPGDHKFLFNHLATVTHKIQTLEYSDDKGRQHIYRWINDVPLNGTTRAGKVNFFDYTIKAAGKTNFHSSWVTDIPVNQDNVKILVVAGRSRWKIENEYFNTLKNQGYNAEHNYGHGTQYASFNFLLFILLAFFVHQILELSDPLYQHCRSTFSSRKEYWNHLRCAIRIHIFSSYEHLLEFMITATKDPQPP